MIISVFVAGKLEVNGHRGIINGNGEGNYLSMKYVKKQAKDDIKIGEKILTSGYDDDSNYPKNIAIGVVSNILVNDYETSISLELEPVLDFSRLEYVFVLNTTSSNIKEAE